MGYSLDGKQNITITGNSTIAKMANGLHSITVYANDTYGNMGYSQTVTFKVSLANFPNETVVISIAVAVLVVISLLTYFKKRKRATADGLS